jgi:mono/diheme cytochrome c family protein
MDYPFWDIGIGYGLLMASVAVLHVFISHFAIGGGLYLVVTETAARRANDVRRLAYLQSLTRFFVLVTLVLGALTGVGIWFVIGLLNPAATEVLIHNFVWAWAIEWTFFVVEICAAIVYYYGWNSMTARRHMAVGWVYFAAAWLSLFVINGIVGFMLTPGRWLETGGFWDGFFNPTFWPSLVFRTGICILLAGVYAMVVASRAEPEDLRGRVVRYNAAWSMIGAGVILPSSVWYWLSIPAEIRTTAFQRTPISVSSLELGLWCLGILVLVIAFFGFLIPKRLRIGTAVTALVLALGFFGGFEWTRESIRKPYAIYGYMYGNAVAVADAEKYRTDGYLAYIAFKTGDDGADLFRRACRSCHTIRGYHPLNRAFDGTDADFIAAMVRGTRALKGNMPPFLGTDEEAALIAAHIQQRVDRRRFKEIHRLEGIALGQEIYDVRCGLCHEIGGYNDKSASLAGLTEEDIGGILDAGSDYGEEMPDFTGDEDERAALIAYIRSLDDGGER